MNKHTNPPCKSHFIHQRMSDFAPENVTSAFADTDSSIGEASPLYLNPFTEIVVDEEAVTRVVGECLEARGESNDEEEMIEVVKEGGVGAGSGAESEGFKFMDALRRANLIAASDPETVLDTSGMLTCKNHLYDNL